MSSLELTEERLKPEPVAPEEQEYYEQLIEGAIELDTAEKLAQADRISAMHAVVENLGEPVKGTSVGELIESAEELLVNGPTTAGQAQALRRAALEVAREYASAAETIDPRDAVEREAYLRVAHALRFPPSALVRPAPSGLGARLPVAYVRRAPRVGRRRTTRARSARGDDPPEPDDLAAASAATRRGHARLDAEFLLAVDSAR